MNAQARRALAARETMFMAGYDAASDRIVVYAPRVQGGAILSRLEGAANDPDTLSYALAMADGLNRQAAKAARAERG